MAPKKKKKRTLTTANPVKTSENSSKKQFKNTVIISSIAAVVIVALALITVKFRSAPPAENNIIKSETSGDVITIINPETNETSEIKILPASAIKSTSNIPPAENTTVPAESKNLFKKTEKKTEIQKINLKEAKELFDSQKALFIDTRNIRSYNSGHIKGAVPIQVNASPGIFEKYKNKMQNKVLVTYCNGIGCHISDKVAYNLFDKGYRQIAIFFGGWNEWVKAGYPVESSD